MDKHTPEQRSQNMKAIKNKDSQIELKLRRELFRKGYRYRKNCTNIFGKPDIVFLKEKIAIFCDSEFWHGYDWENQKARIHSRREFWIPKIERNIERDKEVRKYLETDGYIVLRFWGNHIKQELDSVVSEIESTIRLRRDRISR